MRLGLGLEVRILATEGSELVVLKIRKLTLRDTYTRRSTKRISSVSLQFEAISGKKLLMPANFILWDLGGVIGAGEC